VDAILCFQANKVKVYISYQFTDLHARNPAFYTALAYPPNGKTHTPPMISAQPICGAPTVSSASSFDRVDAVVCNELFGAPCF
jgi:hypothetical protein